MQISSAEQRPLIEEIKVIAHISKTGLIKSQGSMKYFMVNQARNKLGYSKNEGLEQQHIVHRLEMRKPQKFLIIVHFKRNKRYHQCLSREVHLYLRMKLCEIILLHLLLQNRYTLDLS